VTRGVAARQQLPGDTQGAAPLCHTNVLLRKQHCATGICQPMPCL
jgi:hypothetical protein